MKNSVRGRQGEHQRQPHARATFEQAEHGDRGALDLSQELHDPAEHGIGAGAAHLNSEQAVQRHGAGENGAAGPDVVVKRLAGDGGLVHARRALREPCRRRRSSRRAGRGSRLRASGCWDRRAPRRRCAIARPGARRERGFRRWLRERRENCALRRGGPLRGKAG